MISYIKTFFLNSTNTAAAISLATSLIVKVLKPNSEKTPKIPVKASAKDKRSIFRKGFLLAKRVYTKTCCSQIAGSVHDEEETYDVARNLRNEQYAGVLCDSLDGVHFFLRERVKLYILSLFYLLKCFFFDIR